MWDLQFKVEELKGFRISLFTTTAECEVIQEKYTLEVIE